VVGHKMIHHFRLVEGSRTPPVPLVAGCTPPVLVEDSWDPLELLVAGCNPLVRTLRWHRIDLVEHIDPVDSDRPAAVLRFDPVVRIGLMVRIVD
jgi:hypothetical protein